MHVADALGLGNIDRELDCFDGEGSRAGTGAGYGVWVHVNTSLDEVFSTAVSRIARSVVVVSPCRASVFPIGLLT